MKNSGDHSLHEQLDRWRALTEKERILIETSDWSSLSGVQDLKLTLQNDILATLGMAQDPSAHRNPPQPGSMDPLVRSLIVSEERNLKLLNEKLDDVAVEKRRLRRSSLGLKSIQRAYVNDSSGSWEVYS